MAGLPSPSRPPRAHPSPLKPHLYRRERGDGGEGRVKFSYVVVDSCRVLVLFALGHHRIMTLRKAHRRGKERVNVKSRVCGGTPRTPYGAGGAKFGLETGARMGPLRDPRVGDRHP